MNASQQSVYYLTVSAIADHPKRRSDVSERVVEGEMVVLDREAGLIHQLNRTASFIWQRCDGQSTVPEIAVQLADTFDVSPDAAQASVTAVLRQFDQLDLLERPRD